jgi:hypothetical protein
MPVIDVNLKLSYRYAPENFQEVPVYVHRAALFFAGYGPPADANLDRVAKSPFVAFCSTESEKRGFHFPYKSMTYIGGH